MKILQLSKFYKPYNGGVESVVKDISENLVIKGHTVTVIATDPNLTTKTELLDGVIVKRSKQIASFSSVSFSFCYIFDVLKNITKHDVLHVHLPNPLANLALILASLLRINRVPIILHWHSDIIKQKYLLVVYWPLLKWLLNKSDKIIVTSKAYLEHSEQLKGYKKKVRIIPIGIESIEKKINNKIVKDIQDRYKGKKIIFSLGRHIYYKGFEQLIEAAKSINNAVILIGGIGPDTDRYNDLIKEYKLEAKVFLIGRVETEELPSYFFAADVFCFPSIEKSEAFGVVQLEAMSVGTPVISTNIKGSGVPWVNKHNISGLICEPKSVNSLVLALNSILLNKSKRVKLGEGAKLRFSKYFTVDKMVNSVIQLYGR